MDGHRELACDRQLRSLRLFEKVRDNRARGAFPNRERHAAGLACPLIRMKDETVTVLRLLHREEQKAAMYLIERALRADVVFNALDVRGLASASLAPDRSHINEPTETRTLDSQESSARGGVLEDLAYGTGGTYFHNNNDLDEGLRRTADPPEYVYVLGFSPQKLDGKLHKLKVKLNVILTSSASLHGVAVGIDLVDLAQVQLADAGFHLAHVSYHHPHQVVR